MQIYDYLNFEVMKMSNCGPGSMKLKIVNMISLWILGKKSGKP